MLTFTAYRDDILQKSLVCGAENAMLADKLATDRVLAAAAIVAAEHGVAWCREDLNRFVEYTVGRLGFWVSILMFFLGGTGLFWVLAKILLPIVADWLNEQQLFGACGSGPNDAGLLNLAAEAKTFLNNTKE